MSSTRRDRARLSLFLVVCCMVLAGLAGLAMAGAAAAQTTKDDTQGTASEPGQVLQTVTATPTACTGTSVVTGSITLSDTMQTGRLFRDLVASTCAAPKTCPAITDLPFTRAYDAYSYTNYNSATACITVNLNAGTCYGSNEAGLFTAAYLGSFNPNNLCANYLADSGSRSDQIQNYSFNVPAGATFVVVVHAVNQGGTCPQYTVTVSGNGCPTGATPTRTPTGVTNTPTITRTPTQTLTPCPGCPTSTPTRTATPCPMTFIDVLPSDWFYQYVRCLYCRGAISGYADRTFRPYNNTTRGQMTKIIVIAFNYPIYTPPQPTFNDVPVTDPFYQYIETAAYNEIVSGYSDGSFRPNNSVTRGQLSKIVVVAAEWPLINPPTPTFSDVPVENPFYTYIETAYDHGIISGYADGTFRPGNNATRGQIAKIVYSAVTAP